MGEKKRIKEFLNKTIYANNPVHGTTPIHHKTRIALKLTMEEYCMAHLVEKVNAENKVLDYERVYTNIGIKETEEVDRIVKSLFEKKILKKVGGLPVVTAAWTEAHRVSLDENFEKFWSPAYDRSWTGSKPLAKERYSQLLENVSHDYLLAQKLAYFSYLKLAENAFRHTMQASEFLHPKYERYAEDWAKQSEEIVSRRNGGGRKEVVGESTMTGEQQREMF